MEVGIIGLLTIVGLFENTGIIEGGGALVKLWVGGRRWSISESLSLFDELLLLVESESDLLELLNFGLFRGGCGSVVGLLDGRGDIEVGRVKRLDW